MDEETWTKVVKVVAPGMIQMGVRNVAFSLFYFILYLSNYLINYL